MGRTHTFRVASGTPDGPFSGVWRMIVDKDDVYLGVAGKAMGLLKMSLHQSGVWILAGTKQSGVTFGDGNRRAKQWQRPLPHAPGVTRGPSILVPHTSLGARPLLPGDNSKPVTWFRAPAPGETVEFNMYFVESNAPTNWDPAEILLVEHQLASRGRVLLFGASRSSPPSFLSTVEGLLRDNIFRMKAPQDYAGGSFLWFTQSPDSLSIPFLVDLPVHVQAELPPS